MAENTAIEWTDVTDNIIVVKGGGWWCHKISPGCQHCYAANLNQNDFFGGNHLQYGGKPPALLLRHDILGKWKRQTKSRRHFVASMTDVFGEWVPREWIFHFLDAMNAAPRQTFQVLSKRTHIMRRQVCDWLTARGLDRVPPHIWLGASVEDQGHADLRIPDLVQIPGVRFLSIEPLLGPVDLGDSTGLLDWIIVGGESGRKARPMHPNWVRLLRDQAIAMTVAFFFKQWGEWRPANQGVYAAPKGGEHTWPDGEVSLHVGKHPAGRAIDGAIWHEFPTSRPPRKT